MAYVAPVQTIATILPGMGAGTAPAFQLLNQAVAAGATTTLIVPASGNLLFNGVNVAFTKGWVRCRLSNNGATATVSVLITATDGVLVQTILLTPTTVTSTNIYDIIYPFFSELNLNRFTFAITTVGAGGTFTADLEVTGNP